MKIKTNKKSQKAGFTLVELIVVIVIVLVLAMVLVPSLMKYIKSAREASAIACAKQFQTAYTASLTEFVVDSDYDYDASVTKGYAYEAVTNTKSAPTEGRSKFVYDTMNAGSAPHKFEAIALYNVTTYQVELIRYKDIDLNEVFEWTPEQSWHKYKAYPANPSWTADFSNKTGTSLDIWWNGHK